MTEWHSCPDDQSQGRADVDENIDQSQCGTHLFMNLNFYAPWMSPMIFLLGKWMKENQQPTGLHLHHDIGVTFGIFRLKSND